MTITVAEADAAPSLADERNKQVERGRTPLTGNTKDVDMFSH